MRTHIPSAQFYCEPKISLLKKAYFLSWYLFPIRRKDNRVLLSLFYYIIISLSLDIQLCSLFFSICRIIFPLCFNYENICIYRKVQTHYLIILNILPYFSFLLKQLNYKQHDILSLNIYCAPNNKENSYTTTIPWSHLRVNTTSLM